ncbi:HAMP domain-containing protein [Glaciecola sp. MH2013]|uniref:sensor histidine kinase n=1 Tax=Glaciecola sp. MH2013 TaxID=2785524 RepID=UPI0018A0E09F|nr:ATP-binding protein [Glaciecola sp. MH2013]MBF7073503.1 HAMP domain-containing protein [Glaciecola sp. MH2013]
MRVTLTAKTIVGTALIEATLLLVLVVTATKFMANIANENLIKRADTASQLFATTTKNAVLSFDLASLDAISNDVLSNPDIVYAKVYDDEGRLLAGAGDLSFLSRPFELDEFVEDVTDGVFDTTTVISEGDLAYGRVELGISISNMQATINKVTGWMAVLAVFEIALVALFSWFLGAYLTKQLNTLRKGVKNITTAIDSGHFDVARVPTDSEDEIAEVATSFNSLVDNLEIEYQRTQSFQNALQGLNRTLEMKVKRRTQQVQSQNEELTQINQDLKSTQQKLLQAEKMASVGQLAAGVAHEINNPVGFINSNVSSLKDYVQTYSALSVLVDQLTKSIKENNNAERDQVCEQLIAFAEAQDFAFINDDVKELIADTEDGLNRVIEIVKNMKSFSRADSDTMQLFDINQCISTSAKMVKSKVEQKGELILELQALPQTLINVGKINQVVTNLIVNAAQALDTDGKVIVKSYPQGNTIVVEVKDNGSGMDKQTLKNIFNPFFTTKAEGEGTGLGLSISFEIIQEHGGFIEVDSRLGEGSTFILSLPISQDEAAQNIKSDKVDDLEEQHISDSQTTNDSKTEEPMPQKDLSHDNNDNDLIFDNDEDGEFL